MKTHLKYLLGLVFTVLIFGGCQNPSGPETPEVNEPPVIETPEDNSNLTKVEFSQGKYPQVSAHVSDKAFCSHLSRYLLGLYSDQNGNSYYKYPKGYDKDKYKELYNNEECLKKFYEDAFEEVFGTKYYKEGTTIDLKKWTSRAVDLVESDEDEGVITTVQLYFLAEDIGIDYDQDIYKNYYDYISKNSFDEFEVKNEDIVVYIYWDMNFQIEYQF